MAESDEAKLKSATLEGFELDLQALRARARARVKPVAPPESILSNLQNIPFAVGEKVMDTVTGLEVEVAGFGIQNVPSEGSGT